MAVALWHWIHREYLEANLPAWRVVLNPEGQGAAKVPEDPSWRTTLTARRGDLQIDEWTRWRQDEKRYALREHHTAISLSLSLLL